MSGRFEPRTAPLPNDEWSEPLAPWRVEARSADYSQTHPVVTLTLYRVTQDGPNDPRVMRTLPADMSITEARELIAALTAAVEHVDVEAKS